VLLLVFGAFFQHSQTRQHIVNNTIMGYFLTAFRPLSSFALTSSTSSSLGGQHHLLRHNRNGVGVISSHCLRAHPTSKQQQQQQQPYSTHASFSDDIIDRYDAFILDQFGVMHNGINSLEGAVELVEYLYQKNKKLIILSNTSAPADKALAKLPKFGFDSSHFTAAVTSGEEACRYIREKYGFNKETASKVLMLTWDASNPDNPRLTALPEAFLEQSGNIELATSVDDADFLLLHGSEVWYRGSKHEPVSLGPYIERGGFEAVDPILEKCLDRKLPAVCANPDFVVQTPAGDGGVAHMPGKIAQRYQDLGGTCRTFGKPAVEHFAACIRKLGIDKNRVAHVGDSLHHDIAGAVKAGIPCVFVTSGIHMQQLNTKFGELPDPDILEKLLQEESILPTHIIPAFRL
jgi:ribonucleotide monophosphatase NagD (HAD superfamily)